MGCKSLVRLGQGVWRGADSHVYSWDNHKYVCEDDFETDEPCLVYSFGVGSDASFEEVVADIGKFRDTLSKVKRNSTIVRNYNISLGYLQRYH